MNDNVAKPMPAGATPPAMSPATPDVKPAAAAPAPTGLIVFGRDARGKAHASHFTAADAALAQKAAGLMHMRVLPLTTDEHRALATKLPAGRLFESGAAFVPFCRNQVHEQLAATPGAFAPTQPAEAGLPPRGLGKPVGGRGARRADPGDQAPVPTSGPAGEPASASAKPARLAVGAVVLACEGEEEGWWEAVVAAEKGDDLLVLRWRDWPDLPVFVRRRDHLASLPPGLAGKQG